MLPALLRKIHLGKCLEGLDWVAIRCDLDKRPIGGVSGIATEEEIMKLLEKYGVRHGVHTSGVDVAGCADGGFSFLPEPEGSFSNRWLTTVLIDPELTGGIGRDTVRKALARENIESRPLWKPLHLQPVFKRYPMVVNGVSENLFERGLCLPSGTGMTEDDLRPADAIVVLMGGSPNRPPFQRQRYTAYGKDNFFVKMFIYK